MTIALFIEPQSHHFLNDRLFAAETALFGGDKVLAPYAALRDFFLDRDIPIHTSDRLGESRAGRKIYVSLGMRQGYRELAERDDIVLSAFFAIECPVVEPALYRALPELQRHYKRVYSWSDSKTLEPVTRAPLSLKRFFWPQSFDRVHDELWKRDDRDFLVMMNSNKLPALSWNELYTERLRAVDYFSSFDEIHLYGRGWDGPPFRLGYGILPGAVQHVLRSAEGAFRRFSPDPVLSAARRAWKGAADSKSETISRYDFAICFENAAIKGWITEKIFDCFFAGTVPVYWGAPDIAEHVPARSFIDMRNYSTYEELRRFLKGLSAKEIAQYRETARDFIHSEAFGKFRKDAFVDIFRAIVEEDGGVAL